MKNSVIAFVCLLALIGAASAQPHQKFTSTTPEEAGFSSDRLHRLDTFLQHMIDEGHAPNIVTFVAHRGKIIHNKVFGFRNLEMKEPIRKNDIFRWASQTKAITSVALMTLYEEGRFLLEDPISKYIPAFNNPQVIERYDTSTQLYHKRPAKSEITIRHLLSHTAGIPYGNPLPGHSKFSALNFLPAISNRTLAETIPLLGERPLIADPGEKFVYGPSTDVLGYLIEILSGMSLADYLEQKIFKPLNMIDSYFYLPDSKAKRLVNLYTLENAGDQLSLHSDVGYRNYPLLTDGKYYLGGAGLVGTIEDYAKFCQMILNGGSFNGNQIISRKTIELMGRNQIGDLEVRDRKDKFGLGFQIITNKSHYGDLVSEGSLTWGGMFSTEYTIDFKEELILLVYTNVDPYLFETELERKFRILVYQALK